MNTSSEIFHKEHFLNRKILELRTISGFNPANFPLPPKASTLRDHKIPAILDQTEEDRTDQKTRGLWCLRKMSRANQMVPWEFKFKASATSKDHCQRIGLGDGSPCTGLYVIRRVQTDCMATGRKTVWVWESNPLKSCLGTKITSHFQAWPCGAFFVGFLDPNNKLPFSPRANSNEYSLWTNEPD